jgi:hypothetical protein
MKPNKEDDIWKRIIKQHDGCWIWQGAKDKDGYGWITILQKMYKVHRVAWSLCNGPIPEDMFICHHCDNPSCCNPAHLFLGTNSDNMQDMLGKGLGNKAKGERVFNAKLNEEAVMKIKAAYGTKTQREIAKEFGITFQNVNMIIHGKTWKHLL